MLANAMQDTLADQHPGLPFAGASLYRLQPRDRAGKRKLWDGSLLLTWNPVGL